MATSLMDGRVSARLANKQERQRLILELVEQEVVSSQEELRQLLMARGCDVTQATLSRDLRDLGLVRVNTTEGLRYVAPQALAEDESPDLQVMLPQFFGRISGVNELSVLHTLPGGAQPIAEAIDAEDWDEVLGTIGGENTILIVCRSAADRQAVEERILRLAASGR
ncbi:MAG: arginine repressor [Gemmatimonadaceae bacterium]